MDVQLLEDIGLTKAQALAYKALVDNRQLSAPALARHIGENRTNGYKVLGKLCEYGLAVKQKVHGKYKYTAASPAALEQLIQGQASAVHQREQRLNGELPHMLDYFFARSERPSIRYFEGREGLEQIYYDQLKTGQSLYYIRALDDVRFHSAQRMHALRNLFAKLGIQRHVIVQDAEPRSIPPKDRVPVELSDKAMRLTRTWIEPEEYTAPVEWTAYGNKLSVVSYGQEAMGLIIESEQIAESFRQIFALLDKGIRAHSSYAQRPLKATYTYRPDRMRRKSSKGNN